MSIADIALFLAGAFLIIRGLFRGASGEVFSLLSVVGGFYCATRFYAPAARMLSERVGLNHLISTGLSMFAIFLTVNLFCAVADKIIKKLLAVTRLSLSDKLGGAFIGFVKAYVVALLLLVSGAIISPVTGEEWIRESKALTVTARTWPFVYPLLDAAGLLPDLAELQGEASEYIVRQAAGRLYGPNTDFGARVPVSTDIASADIKGALSGVSLDAEGRSGDQGTQTVPFPQDPVPAPSKNQMLDFLLK
jgi:membrane protein required for colicin V production